MCGTQGAPVWRIPRVALFWRPGTPRFDVPAPYKVLNLLGAIHVDDSGRRIKLERFELERNQDEQCTGRAILAWQPGDVFVGTAMSEDSLRGHLRCGAEATARALELASEGRVALEVLAVRAIEGFDTVLVIVSLSSQYEKGERLAGSCLMKGQPPRSAAMAVLNATNRLYGRAVLGSFPQRAAVH